MSTSSKQQTQTVERTTQKNDPWAPAVPSLTRGLTAANQNYDSRMGQQFFGGQTYANYSPETEQALKMTTDRATAGSDLMRGAQGSLNDTISGKYLAQGNPNFGLMAGRITEQVLPSITAQWARAGRGTGNTGVVEAASQGLGDSIGQLAYQNYNDERGRMMQATGMAPQFAAADYADADRLRTVGADREFMTQQGINEQMMRDQYEKDKQANALREFQGFTTPIAQLGSTSEGTRNGTTTQTSQPSGLQSALGLGLMGASAFTGGGPLAGVGSSLASSLGLGGMGLSPGMLQVLASRRA